MGGFYWLSFADPNGFLGACVVGPCPSFMAAIVRAAERGCNPGGQVVGEVIPEAVAVHLRATDLHTLKDRAQCEEFDRYLERFRPIGCA